MTKQRTYRGQGSDDLSQANHRYQILPGDYSGLYRRHYRETYHIDVRTRPEYNVDDWLNPTSAQFKPALASSIFYYSARTTENERLKVCIATPEMREATWTYCHKKQLILDGTFGICSSRLLLWIALAIDGTGSGVPIAMFLLSAPTGTRATHAGYDTAIIAELLSHWRSWLGMSNGEVFTPYVAITDTDTKERGALIMTWDDIILILCKFHVRQCWTNKRKQLLAKGETEGWKVTVKQQLRSLEET